jgi:hypothetical protein
MWNVEFANGEEVSALELGYKWDNIPPTPKINHLLLDMGAQGEIKFVNFNQYAICSTNFAITGNERGTLIGFTIYAIDKRKKFVIILTVTGDGMRMIQRPLDYLQVIGLVKTAIRKGVINGHSDVKFTGILQMEKEEAA